MLLPFIAFAINVINRGALPREGVSLIQAYSLKKTTCTMSEHAPEPASTEEKLREAYSEAFESFSKQCSSREVVSDRIRWEIALRASSRHHNIQHDLRPLGQVVHTIDRVLYVLPALVDLELLPGDVYTTAIALYLFEQPADTVLIDTRAGSASWPNLSVLRMLRWIRNVARTLPHLYDNTQVQILLFPVPGWAIRIFNLVTNKQLRETMVPVPGQETSVDSPFPKEHLEEYIEPYVLDTIETLRDGIINDPFSKR